MVTERAVRRRRIGVRLRRVRHRRFVSEHRRARFVVRRNLGRRVLHRRSNHSGRVINRVRSRVCGRRCRHVRRRCVDHRRVDAAVARSAARSLDDGPAGRGGRDVPASLATAPGLDDRALADRHRGAVVTRRESSGCGTADVGAARGNPAAGNPTATAEHSAFLAEDGPMASSRSPGGTGSHSTRANRSVAANPGASTGPGSSGRANSGSTGRTSATAGLDAAPYANGRGLRSRVASLAGSTDAKTRTASGAGLASHSDAPERARDMRSSCTVQGGALTGDQSGLSVGADVADASQAASRSDTGLTAESRLAADAETCLSGDACRTTCC